MKNSITKAVLSIIIVFAVIACFSAAFSSCSNNNEATTSAQTEALTTEKTTEKDETSAAADTNTTAAQAEEIGTGSTQFLLTVTFADGTQKSYTVNTDEKTVGAALSALNIVEGEQGQYGLYINAVNGVVADYATDGTYWAFYQDGKYAETGVDKTDIVPGTLYELKVEKG